MKKNTRRQQEILDSALDIIAEKGIQNLTIKNLAMAQGVCEPALYRHFDTKMDILLMLVLQYKVNFISLLDNLIKSDMPSIEKVTSFYTELFKRFTERPALSAIIFSEELFRYDKRLSEKVSSLIVLTHIKIKKLFQAGKRNKEIKADISAGELAWIVMGTMRIAVAKWRLSGYSYNLAKEGKQLLKAISRLV